TAPVLAWNLQSFSAERRARGGERQRPRAALQVAGVLLGLVLLVCAWPGWLQARPFEPRRWAVELPPSLERGAAMNRRWHRDGNLPPDTRALHLSPDTAYAFAWFCPEEKGLLDRQLASAIRGEPDAPADWVERMRSARVNRVILYDPDRDRLFATL